VRPREFTKCTSDNGLHNLWSILGKLNAFTAVTRLVKLLSECRNQEDIILLSSNE
jgi:hypothetical protein